MIQKRKNGGRGETRTPDPLLAKIGRTKNQQLSRNERNDALMR
jgi:hypothetical protein